MQLVMLKYVNSKIHQVFQSDSNPAKINSSNKIRQMTNSMIGLKDFHYKGDLLIISFLLFFKHNGKLLWKIKILMMSLPLKELGQGTIMTPPRIDPNNIWTEE
jgi:hypothetical protein